MKATPLILAAAVLSLTPAQAQSPSFAGRTIKAIINFPAGGSTDILMRRLAPYIAEHIPGKPTIVIENRPGAGGLVATNYFYNQVKPDGATIGFLTGIAANGLIGIPRAKYDAAKLAWLGALPQTQVTVGAKDLGVAGFQSLRKPKKPIVHASTGAHSSSAILSKLFYDMTGVPHKFVAGYRGQAGTDLALQHGEVNVADMGIAIYMSKFAQMQKDGKIDAILQRGVLNDDGSFARHPLLKNIPTMVEAIQALNPSALKSKEFEAYAFMAGTFGLQFSIVLPPGANADMVAMYRKAVAAGLDNQATKAAVAKSLGYEFDFIDGAAAQKLVESLKAKIDKSPELRKLLAAMVQPKKKK